VIRMQNVFGPKYTKELLQSEKKFHVIVSEWLENVDFVVKRVVIKFYWPGQG
jgi:hypothetical protein